LGYISSIR